MDKLIKLYILCFIPHVLVCIGSYIFCIGVCRDLCLHMGNVPMATRSGISEIMGSFLLTLWNKDVLWVCVLLSHVVYICCQIRSVSEYCESHWFNKYDWWKNHIKRVNWLMNDHSMYIIPPQMLFSLDIFHF